MAVRKGGLFLTFLLLECYNYMKIFFLVITAFLLFFSCASAPPPKTFSVDLASQRHEAGEIEAYLDRYLSIGGLKKSPVNVYYYPNEDAVCLQFKVQFINCNQFWDKTGRDTFVAALKRYQEEYEQKKLVNRNRKTRDVYGTVQGFFTWKKTPVSVQAKGSPKVSFGYQFKDKAVFFTTTQGEARYEDPNSRDRSHSSPVLLMYFTRAQAESLAELFSQEYLQGLGGKASGGTDEGYRELDGY